MMFAIKKMRETRTDYSQDDVAKILGIKTKRYGDWERETTIINLSYAIKLADLFGCTLDELANHVVEGAGPLTLHEQRMLDVYRSVDDRGKECIDRAVNGEQLGMLSRAAEKEVSVAVS